MKILKTDGTLEDTPARITKTLVFEINTQEDYDYLAGVEETNSWVTEIKVLAQDVLALKLVEIDGIVVK